LRAAKRGGGREKCIKKSNGPVERRGKSAEGKRLVCRAKGGRGRGKLSRRGRRRQEGDPRENRGFMSGWKENMGKKSHGEQGKAAKS